MSHVEEGAQQFRGEDPFEDLPVFLEGADVPEETEQEYPELIEGLGLIFLFDVFELDHVAVGGVGAYEESDGIVEAVL